MAVQANVDRSTVAIGGTFTDVTIEMGDGANHPFITAKTPRLHLA